MRVRETLESFGEVSPSANDNWPRRQVLHNTRLNKDGETNVHKRRATKKVRVHSSRPFRAANTHLPHPDQEGLGISRHSSKMQSDGMGRLLASQMLRSSDEVRADESTKLRLSTLVVQECRGE
eukprot:6270258-Amphidinium_carterae.1